MSGTEKKKPIYCWDTCVFLAWFKEEQDKPLADIALVVHEIESRSASLLLSVTTYEEVLDIEGGAVHKFRDYIKRPYVETANVDTRIAERVAAMRNAAAQDGMNIKVPDAQIIATALQYKADVLHTFDDKVLRFHKKPIVEGLRIEHPMPLSRQQGLRPIVPVHRIGPHLHSMLYRVDGFAPWGPTPSPLAKRHQGWSHEYA